MPQPQVYEGTAEEIVQQIRDGNLTGRYRAIVVPEVDSEFDGREEVGETLLERLKGRVGRFDFGDANLSEDTGRKFAALLAEKHRKALFLSFAMPVPLSPSSTIQTKIISDALRCSPPYDPHF